MAGGALALPTAGAAAAAAAPPVASGLLMASTLASVGFSVLGGFQERAALREQRAAERTRQQQTTLQGVQRSNQILQDQIDTLAALNVTAAAGGIDPFSGGPNAVADRIRRRANRQLTVAATDTAADIAASRSRERQLATEGTARLVSGFARGSGSLLDTATRLQGL